jgi:hypothetical protein
MSDEPIRVQITDPNHPHFPEHGAFTGKVISVLGTSMAEVKLDHCRHGTGGCFVLASQFRREVVTPTERPSRRKTSRKRAATPTQEGE